MDVNKNLNDIAEIKELMNKSSRFISLSGLSGVFAGIFALAGAVLVFFRFMEFFSSRISADLYNFELLKGEELKDFITFSIIIGIAVFISAVLTGLFFTLRKAKRNNQKIWDLSVKKLLINLFIPLITGGVFIFALLYHGIIYLIAPTTLVFYGLALINASKFTFRDVRFLGISEVILGLISMFFVGYGIFFWALGFGVLHIIYGISMYIKYDRK